jgi:hypothetical protein
MTFHDRNAFSMLTVVILPNSAAVTDFFCMCHLTNLRHLCPPTNRTVMSLESCALDLLPVNVLKSTPTRPIQPMNILGQPKV